MIFLIGAPASGKTTLGRRLADSLGVSFYDLDEEICASSKRSIPEIFATDGEEAFRDIESKVLEDVVRSAPSAAVVSLGGGALLKPENRALCEKSGDVFCLDNPDIGELERRINIRPGSRPLGNRLAERKAHYDSFPKRIASFFDAGDSLVVVGSGIAPSLISSRRIVADSTVAGLYQEVLPPALFRVPSGEANKHIGTVASVWAAFAAGGIGRSDVVCAVGGGVTGDLVGFAASTWMRGIDWINVPTTLLSMVDASTGGKTGCDLPEGKNLAGTFHQPRLVAIDTDFLKTLPASQLASGRAEMIKHEIIGGLERGAFAGIPAASEIAANLMVKVGIVREDPFEKLGRRILLNCGHTVGHAVEKATNYEVSHGAAVAIGCVEEARLAVRLGLAHEEWPSELASRFSSAGLPVGLPAALSFDSLVDIMKGDKKRNADVVTFALPCAWGDVRAVPIDLAKGV